MLTYTHKTDHFALNYFWVYMIRHWWLYRSKCSSPRSPKKEIKSLRNLKFSQPLATRYEKLFSPTNKIFVFKCHQNHLFLFKTHIHYFYTWSFQVPPEKNHPYLKSQLSSKLPIWPISLLFKPSEKRLNFQSPLCSWDGGCKR